MKTLKKFISLSFHISPAYFFLLIFQSMMETGQVLVNVILPKYLVDELVGGRNRDNLIRFGLYIVLSNVAFLFLNKTMKRIMDVRNIYMKEKLNQAMADKIMKVEFACLEDPYYLDLKERAVFACRTMSALENLIGSVAKVLNNTVTILSLLVVMFTLSPIFVLLLVLTISISVVAQKFFSKYQLEIYKELIPINRRYGYYVSLGFDAKYQKDIRLYNMNQMLTDRVLYYNRQIYDWFKGFIRKQGVFQGFVGIINDLQAAIAYGYVGIRVISDKMGGRIGIGSFTMYVTAAINFTTSATDLGKNIMTVIQMLGYLQPFMEFMSLPDEAKKEGSIPFEGEVESLCFENVTFHYPKSEQLVLKGISFEIKKGEKISVVGLNGAGKSTIVKLLCRLYKPASGTIYINGRDIYEYEFTSYMKCLAAVFQDYKLFAFSVLENIRGGEEEEENEINRERVASLLGQVGLKEKMEELPKGMDTLFGKQYDPGGIEMSGGQSQKVAIARALYKEASLIILDEPTSALDPLAEAEIYEHFNQLVGDKTAIYISHRMSSSVFCDKILVLDGGLITDFDSHKKLMEKEEGMYYKLFQSQAVNYQI
ncbi:ABC transporter ATP-binding protein [Anaerocolumna xylanovorans]|nr:ABC transporter ATP-binding protein [Anaerocolumna xylanovorans]